MRETSNIKVKVIDLDEIKEVAFENLEPNLTEEHNVIGLLDNGPFGIVETEQGIYIINHLGEGSAYPVTPKTPGPILQFFICLEDGGFIPQPSMKLLLTYDALPNLKTSKTVTLDQFISRVSPQQETIYETWNYFFQKQKPIPVLTCPLIRSKADLKKYKPFISEDYCECETFEPLIEVGENICCNNKQHAHCKHCGGRSLS